MIYRNKSTKESKK